MPTTSPMPEPLMVVTLSAICLPKTGNRFTHHPLPRRPGPDDGCAAV
jgi:hypothetical protein